MQSTRALLAWFPAFVRRSWLSYCHVRNFTALELEKIIQVFEAAGLNNQHEDTFRRNFPHLIRKVGKRKTGVKLRDAITLPSAP